MRAEFIDPRDQTLQVDDPTYRVFFWTEGGGAKEEWEVQELTLMKCSNGFPHIPAGGPAVFGQ
jgi:hypothetical protein